jgi:hypothetical protein
MKDNISCSGSMSSKYAQKKTADKSGSVVSVVWKQRHRTA